MTIIDIREVLELPDPTPYSENPGAFLDFVLTGLFQSRSALLEAEVVDAEAAVRWLVTPRVAGVEQRVRCLVGVSPSLGSFRSVLARANVRFSTNNIYGGFAMQFLRQNARVHRCLIYTSNTGLSDFWIRIYAAEVDPSLWPVD